jgi:hypothetical protein
MKKSVHLSASFYLLFETDLDLEEFQNKYHQENIIDSKVEFILPNGDVHKAVFAGLEDLKIVDFEDNKEKATELAFSDQ